MFRANLSAAYLAGTNSSGADLREVNLEEANLQWADFEAANIEGTCLNGAFLEEASALTLEQLEQSLGEDHTALPIGTRCTGAIETSLLLIQREQNRRSQGSQ